MVTSGSRTPLATKVSKGKKGKNRGELSRDEGAGGLKKKSRNSKTEEPPSQPALTSEQPNPTTKRTFRQLEHLRDSKRYILPNIEHRFANKLIFKKKSKKLIKTQNKS